MGKLSRKSMCQSFDCLRVTTIGEERQVKGNGECFLAFVNDAELVTGLLSSMHCDKAYKQFRESTEE